MPHNSASRAYDILMAAKKMGGNTPTVKVWSEVLKTQGKAEIQDIAPKLVSLYQQLELTEKLTRERFPAEKANVRLKHFNTLKKVVAFNDIHAAWDTNRNTLTDAVLDSLETLAHDLDDEAILKTEELEDITKSILELFKMVRDSSLDDSLKQFVLNWLMKIQRAIDAYQITGTQGLQEALVTIQGEAAFFAPALNDVKQKAPTLYERLTTVYVRVVQFAEFGEKCKKITQSPFVAPVIDYVAKGLGFDGDLPKIGQ